ncbi:MAG: GumC family protein [Desulfovibrio sp.]
MMEFQNDLQFYLRVFKRRKWQCVVPAIGVMVVCTMFALFLPSVYRSQALVLIETQDIPEELVQSTITGLVEERLQSLNRTVLSRSNLLKLIDQFELYKDESRHKTVGEIIEGMRDDINVEMVTTEVHDTELARSGVATYAFTLSYDGKEPEKVLQVANRLVSLYLEANIKSRETKTRSAYQFLEGRLNDLSTQISGVEQRLSAFKEKNKFFLPELVPTNIRILDRVESQLRFKEDDMEKSMGNYQFWLRELASRPQFIQVRDTGGQRLITPEEELDRMRRDLVALKATRSDDHPDVVNLQKQVDALEEQVKYRQDLEDYSLELERKEDELKVLREKFTDKHPDVLRLQKEVEQLHKDIDSISARFMIKPKHKELELNPQWIQAKNSAETSHINLERLQKDIDALLTQQADIQHRIDMAPQVEVENNIINSELEMLKTEREELLKNMLAAKESKGLEESGLGEKFTLVDPPLMPEKPHSPNRPLLFALGMVLSLALGAGVGFTGQLLDRSVHDAEELVAVAHLPVLAVIPQLGDLDNKAGFTRMRQRLPLVVLLSLVAGLLAIHFLVEPLDMIVMRLIKSVF